MHLLTFLDAVGLTIVPFVRYAPMRSRGVASLVLQEALPRVKQQSNPI